MRAAWRKAPGPLQPPVSITQETEPSFQKTEFDTSILPTVDYGTTTVTPLNPHPPTGLDENPSVSGLNKKEGETEEIGAVRRTPPNSDLGEAEEAGIPATEPVRRASRKEGTGMDMDEAIL